MATKKFLIEVEEGITECKNCPFNEAPDCNGTNWIERFIDCSRHNLATMKIKEVLNNEELREYANNYSHGVWRELMERFKADDDFFIGANDVSDYVFNAILNTPIVVSEGEALLYAVTKTAERTKREMIKKAVEWLDNELMFRDHSGGRGSFGEVKAMGSYDSLDEFIEEFKQAMEE